MPSNDPLSLNRQRQRRRVRKRGWRALNAPSQTGQRPGTPAKRPREGQPAAKTSSTKN